MEEISIVRKRSRLWPVVIGILLIAVVVLAVLWLMGSPEAADLGWHDAIELGRRHVSGIA